MRAMQYVGCNHFDHAWLYTNSNKVPQSLLKIHDLKDTQLTALLEYFIPKVCLNVQKISTLMKKASLTPVHESDPQEYSYF